ncbi:hypothetical protein SI65_01978 [Aspergillus cristatus]|uniref:Uncharacterized protein n=1 Tax=Aspergillus cristatus TaxID=573508 RepID=A0A1E3BTV1_ASPCR|nr:hypothetical protein SI65_01904 [Aspergillus cristatus]ODM24388.1 hypothetical protein SI65_01978 [Aspergillus cristatus]
MARALYRFQLYYNLFSVSIGFEDVDILRIFMGNYEPWEVEEIVCIYTFVKAKFNQVFDGIHCDVHPENPRFEDQRRPPTPNEAFDFDHAWNRNFLLDGTVSRGLELLHDVIFKIKDHAHLVSTMQEKISQAKGYSIEVVLDETTQSIRRDEHPSDQDLKQERRDSLPFQGDSAELPPLAWTVIWHGTYSNLFGWYVKDPIRLWGYIMWDAARLEYTGARGLLVRQWKEFWKDFDPRDDL